MLQPVAHHQKVDMEQKIVNRNLVEYFLCDGDVRGFVLDDHAGLQFTGVEHTVGAQHLVATFQLDFVGEQRGRIPLVLDEKMNEMLAHPLFGSERDELPAQHIQYLGMLFFCTLLYIGLYFFLFCFRYGFFSSFNHTSFSKTTSFI